MYDHTHCYVGPAAWWQWVLRINPWWRKFNRAAYLHDRHFADGGGQAELDRANRIFRTMCFAVAKTRWDKFGAELHARACEKFGWAFFQWRESLKNPNCG